MTTPRICMSPTSEREADLLRRDKVRHVALERALGEVRAELEQAVGQAAMGPATRGRTGRRGRAGSRRRCTASAGPSRLDGVVADRGDRRLDEDRDQDPEVDDDRLGGSLADQRPGRIGVIALQASLPLHTKSISGSARRLIPIAPHRMLIASQYAMRSKSSRRLRAAVGRPRRPIRPRARSSPPVRARFSLRATLVRDLGGSDATPPAL